MRPPLLLTKRVAALLPRPSPRPRATSLDRPQAALELPLLTLSSQVLEHLPHVQKLGLPFVPILA